MKILDLAPRGISSENPTTFTLSLIARLFTSFDESGFAHMLAQTRKNGLTHTIIEKKPVIILETGSKNPANLTKIS